jgi:hypothetical protein
MAGATGAASWFVDESKFGEEAQIRKEKDKVLTWTELDTSKIYTIYLIEEKVSEKFGHRICHILYMMDRYGEKVRVWGPSKLVSDLKDKELNQRPFIRSLGQDRCQDKLVNLYDLMFEEADEGIELFAKMN